MHCCKTPHFCENCAVPVISILCFPSLNLRIFCCFFFFFVTSSLHAPHLCRAPRQISLNSLIGLARRGSNPPAFDNFHQMQPPSDSPSQMLHASMLSTMRTPNGSRAYFQAAGHSGSSLEQTMSYIVPSTNLINQNVLDTTTLVDQHAQETHDIVPLQLFPNDFGSFRQEKHD